MSLRGALSLVGEKSLSCVKLFLCVGSRILALTIVMSVCVLCAVAIQYLKRVFPVWEKGVDHKTSPEWVQGLEMPSVPIILSILRGLARGHLATQQYLDKQEILPLLHGLEGVSGENEIGARAENLLDTLADKDGKGEGFLFKTVVNLRHATRDEMRRRALRRREELLEVITPVYTEGGSCGRIATS